MEKIRQMMDHYLSNPQHPLSLSSWFSPQPPSQVLNVGLSHSISFLSGIPEPPLRLLLVILAGYPVALLYRVCFLRPASFRKTGGGNGGTGVTLKDKVDQALQFFGPPQTNELEPSHIQRRNGFLLVMGLSLAFFFCSWDMVHLLVSSIGTWLICRVVGGGSSSSGDSKMVKRRTLACGVSFVFNLGYLLLAYKYAATQGYDICYTMPQCVQCLRMIGYGMDYMDGASPAAGRGRDNAARDDPPLDTPTKTDTASTPAPAVAPGSSTTAPLSVAAQVKKSIEATVLQDDRHDPRSTVTFKEKTPISFGKDIALPTLPSLLETLGYAFFPLAFLVGPQFSFSLYKKFISGTLFQDHHNSKKKKASLAQLPKGSVYYTLRCFALGVIYLGTSQVLGTFFPTGSLLDKMYLGRSFWTRLVIFWWTGKTVLHKYLGIWTLAEGPCALCGISFNGSNFINPRQGQWDGLRNVDPMSYESATSLTQIIQSFNMNTNTWSKFYIFKRLRFLRQKNLSALGVLLFLAIWHGTHPGYFISFGLEFLDMETERRWSTRVGQPIQSWIHQQEHQTENQPQAQILAWMVWVLWTGATWLLTTSALYFAAVPFDMLQWQDILAAMRSIHFLGLWVMVGLLVSDWILSFLFSGASAKRKIKLHKEE